MRKSKKINNIVNDVIKGCVYILLIVFVIYIGKKGFKFGQDVFSEEGYALSPGQDVTITINSGDSNMDVAKQLEKKGVIADNGVFFVQCFMYEAKFKPGQYTVNTSWKAETIIEELSKKNVSTEDESGSSETETTQADNADSADSAENAGDSENTEGSADGETEATE